MKYISSSSYLGRGGRRRSVDDDVGVVADPVEVLAEEEVAVVVGVVMLELLETES